MKLDKSCRPILTLLCILAVSCAGLTPAQESALVGSVTSLASTSAAAYGNPAAAAGLNALGALLQAYVGSGKPVPTAVVAATPGVGSMGAAAARVISNVVPPTQSDAQTVFDVAAKLVKK